MSSTRHMKGLAIVAAASAFALCASTATAGVIHRRQLHQRERIQNGVESGRLTRKEASRLHAEERAIQAERAKARADGNITPRERRSIHQDQDEASRDIRHEKHDGLYQ